MATTEWFKGRYSYDFATGTAKAGATPAKAKAAQQFANMAWKSTKKVGFGVKGTDSDNRGGGQVVAWYCDVPAEPENAELAKKNIGKICNSKGYNGCYNDLALAAHNIKRKHHNTDVLELDEDAARAIQVAMNGATFDGLMPLAKDREAAFTGCAE